MWTSSSSQCGSRWENDGLGSVIPNAAGRVAMAATRLVFIVDRKPYFFIILSKFSWALASIAFGSLSNIAFASGALKQ